jgi:hypothetical protein
MRFHLTGQLENNVPYSDRRAAGQESRIISCARTPQRSQGAEEVSVQQGLGDARGDKLLHPVQRQLLLVPSDIALRRWVAGAIGAETAAMVAGLADHVWSLEEWALFPSTNRYQIQPFRRK